VSSFLPCIVKNTISFTFLQVFFDIFVRVVQQAQWFHEIARFMQTGQLFFPGNSILGERTQFQSSQLS
jgi:hypothetical protein